MDTWSDFSIVLFVVVGAGMLLSLGSVVARAIRSALAERPVVRPAMVAVSRLPEPVREERPDNGWRPKLAGIVELQSYRRGLDPERERRCFVKRAPS